MVGKKIQVKIPQLRHMPAQFVIGAYITGKRGWIARYVHNFARVQRGYSAYYLGSGSRSWRIKDDDTSPWYFIIAGQVAHICRDEVDVCCGMGIAARRTH